MNLSKLQEIAEDRGAQHAADHKVAKSWIEMNDGTTRTYYTNTYSPNMGGR